MKSALRAIAVDYGNVKQQVENYEGEGATSANRQAMAEKTANVVGKMVEYTTTHPIRYYPLVGYDAALNGMIRDKDPLVDGGVIIGAAQGLTYDTHKNKWTDARGYKELAADQEVSVLCMENGEPAVLENSDAIVEGDRKFIIGKVGNRYVLFNASDVVGDAHKMTRHASLEGNTRFASADIVIPEESGQEPQQFYSLGMLAGFVAYDQTANVATDAAMRFTFQGMLGRSVAGAAVSEVFNFGRGVYLSEGSTTGEKLWAGYRSTSLSGFTDIANGNYKEGTVKLSTLGGTLLVGFGIAALALTGPVGWAVLIGGSILGGYLTNKAANSLADYWWGDEPRQDRTESRPEPEANDEGFSFAPII